MSKCAVCSEEHPLDRMVYSRHTQLSYCADEKACVARQARKLRASRLKDERATKEQAA